MNIRKLIAKGCLKLLAMLPSEVTIFTSADIDFAIMVAPEPPAIIIKFMNSSY